MVFKLKLELKDLSPGIDILDDLVFVAEKKHASILTRDTLYVGDNRVLGFPVLPVPVYNM